MNKLRGFRLGHRPLKFFKWIFRPRRKLNRHHLLGRTTRRHNPMSKIRSLARYLLRGAKGLCRPRSDQGVIRLGQVPVEKKAIGVPKGHLAVYVGQSDGDTHRVLVPVIYFNHPLFVELLKEVERVYGFDHSGGITIPCKVSEFEKVQMRIAAWDHYRSKQLLGNWP